MRGDADEGRVERAPGDLSDAESIFYFMITILVTLIIPEIHLRAVSSLVIVLVMLRLRGIHPRLGTVEGSVISPILALTMTIPFASIAEVNYHGAEIVEIASMIPYHLSVAVWEECLYRGFILRRSPPLLILSSSIFSILHAKNPGFGFLPFIGLLSAGIFLCLIRIGWGLIPSVLFHLSWNLSLEHLWGFPTSGLRGPSIFSSELVGPSFMTGGDFGPEGSVLAVVEFALASAILLLKARRARGKFYKALINAALWNHGARGRQGEDPERTEVHN